VNAPDPIAFRDPGSPTLRAFLEAQLRWEHYHAWRLRMVHAMALAGFLSWLLLADGTELPEPVRAALLPAWLVCSAATLYAVLMEWRWSRRRERQMEELRRDAA
jgi:hypothetical protein